MTALLAGEIDVERRLDHSRYDAWHHLPQEAVQVLLREIAWQIAYKKARCNGIVAKGTDLLTIPHDVQH